MSIDIQIRHDKRREELAWAAGFFDGEGCSYVNKRGKGRIDTPQITISQVTSGPLERFQQAVGGLGKISGPIKRESPKQQLQYAFRVWGFEKVQAVAAMLWRFLCEPKRAQFTRVLVHTAALPFARRIPGAELHKYTTPETWRIIGDKLRGRKRSPETRRKISETKRRNNLARAGIFEARRALGRNLREWSTTE